MDRREFCVSSAAAAISGAAAGLSLVAPPASSSSSIRLYKFIYDRRYPAGRAFGTAAEYADTTAGLAAIDGDITSLWSRDLRLHWSAGGGAIAGMTTARTLFCLEQLAQNHWMRVVIRAEHRRTEGRTIAHRLTASVPVIARMRAALTAEDWPVRIPAALTACRGTDAAPRMTCEIAPARDRRSAMTDETLVSFVIA
jgi:hypothetical protein